MEILLKRSKITKSIVSQLMHVGLDDVEEIKTKKVLGFVNHDKKLKILLYSEDKNTLNYLLYPKGLIISGDNRDQVTISLNGVRGSITNKFNSGSHAKEWVFIVKRIKNIADSEGQIFL